MTKQLDSIVLFQPEIEAMGGAERSLLALSRWLWTQNVPNHILTYFDRVGIGVHTDHPVEIVQLQPEMRATKKIASLRRYFAGRPKTPTAMMSGYQGALHGTLAGLRGFHCLMLDTPDLFEDESAMGPKQHLRRWVSDRATGYGMRTGGRTIVNSEHLRDQSRKLFGVESDIVRMGGLMKESSFHLRSVQGQLRLLSVSRVEANKRIDWMLRGLAAMEHDVVPLSSRADWVLDITGRGSQMEALKALAETLGIGSRVNFLGFVSDSDLEDIYGKAHLFLMPAVQGYGIPAIESLVRGLPVLLHRDSGVSDILRETSWATVIYGGEEGMLPGLRRAIDAVIEGVHLNEAPPPVPTEDEWAEGCSKLFGWV